MKKSIKRIIILLFVMISFMQMNAFKSYGNINLEIGDYVCFGHYNNEPILWRVIHKDENGDPLLFSEYILCHKAFDVAGKYNEGYLAKSNGSNYWPDTTIRQWLNSTNDRIFWENNSPIKENIYNEDNPYDKEKGFLCIDNFTKDDVNAIKESTHKILLYEKDKENRDGGNKEYQNPWEISDIEDDINEAYYQYIKDRVFCLSVQELKEYVFDRNWEHRAMSVEQTMKDKNHLDKKKYDNYWLNSPCLVVDRRGQLNNLIYYPNDGYIGIRPALFIDCSLISCSNGNGTQNFPYVIQGKSDNVNIIPKEKKKHHDSLEDQLIRVIQDANQNEVKRLIESGAHIDERIFNEIDDLISFLYKDSDIYKNIGKIVLYEKVKQTLEQGKDINIKDKEGLTLLMRAAKYNDVETINVLIKNNVDIDLTYENGDTALDIALHNDSFDSAITLLYNGAAIKSDTLYGLMTTMEYNEEREEEENSEAYREKGVLLTKFMVAQIIKSGDNTNKIDENGMTPLSWSIVFGNATAVSDLIEARVDINQPTAEGKPYIIAARKNHTDILYLLLSKELKMDINDLKELNKRNECSKIIMDRIVDRALKENDIDQTTDDNNSLLSIACCIGNEKTVEKLINANAKVDSSILHELLSKNQYGTYENKKENKEIGRVLFKEMYKQIISNKEKINKEDDKGFTPIMWVAIYGDREMVEQLINEGAEIDLSIVSRLIVDLYPITEIEESKDKYIIIIEELIQNISNDTLSSGDESELRLLYIVAALGNGEQIETLIDKGINISRYYEYDEYKETPLTWAIKFNNKSTAFSLIEKGGSFNEYDLLTILEKMSSSNSYDELITYKQIGSQMTQMKFKQMIKNHEDINKKDSLGFSLLFWSSVFGDTNTVKSYINEGSDINEIFDDETTPIEAAIFYGSVDTVKELLEVGAYPDQEFIELFLEEYPNIEIGGEELQKDYLEIKNLL